MPEGSYRIIYHHSRSCPTHDIANLLTHIRLVAVYRATLACWFLVAKLAPIKALVSINYKVGILLRELVNSQLATTI